MTIALVHEERVALTAKFADICTEWLRAYTTGMSAGGTKDFARGTFRWIDKQATGSVPRTSAIRNIAESLRSDWNGAPIGELAYHANEVAFDGGDAGDMGTSERARLTVDLPGCPAVVKLVASGLTPWDAMLAADLIGLD